MADKVQNINVNYNIKTVGAEQARQAAVNVQKATETLQQSSQSAGQTISNSYRGAQQSIGYMQIALARLKTQIEVTSNPQRVKQLSDQFKALKTQLDAATKSAFETSKAVKSIGDNTKSVAQNFGQLYNAVKLVIGAGIAKELVQTTLEMASLAGRIEGVQVAFNRAFPNAFELMGRLKDATHGTVSEFLLMQKTLQATNLGLSVEQLPVLFEFAAARAQQTGESVDYLVDSIVTGIGRKSILKLDNLGLSTTRLKEQFNGASLASQSVADVTTGVAAIAKVELEKMGGYIETGETKVKQLTVSWEELRTTFSKRIESAGFIDFLDDVLDRMTRAFKTEEELASEVAKRVALSEITNLKTRELNKEKIKDEKELLQVVTEQINARFRLQGANDLDLLKTRLQLRDVEKESNENLLVPEIFYRGQKEALREQIDTLIFRNQVTEESINLLKGYANELRKLIGDEEETGIIERKKKEIETLNEAIEKTNKSTDLSTRRNIGTLVQQLAIAQAQLNELLAGVPAEIKIKLNLEARVTNDTKNGKNVANATKDFEKLIGLGQEGGDIEINSNVVINPTQVKVSKDFIDKVIDAFKNAKDEIISSGINLTSDIIRSNEEIELASLHARLNATRDFYNEQQLLAGNNERAKSELRIKEEREISALQKKMAEKERSIRRFNVIIDTAATIAKTSAELGYPAAIPFVAIAAAQGAAQLAIINRTPARFAKGVLNLQGPGTETSDSIPSLLSKGESVMTAAETKRSMGLLDAIKKNKIDDRVLKQLHVSSQGVTVIPWDNRPIVDAIKSQKHPDYIRQGRLVYQVETDKNNNKRYIRSKSI